MTIVDDAHAVRAVLPVRVDTMDHAGSSLTLHGEGWHLSIECPGTLDDVDLSVVDWSAVIGTSIVAVEGPGDLYEPVWVLSTGARLLLRADEENTPWYFSAGDVEVDGPSWHTHESWLRGDIQDIEL